MSAAVVAAVPLVKKVAIARHAKSPTKIWSITCDEAKIESVLNAKRQTTVTSPQCNILTILRLKYVEDGTFGFKPFFVLLVHHIDSSEAEE
jgi:hypothetical protein